MPKTMFPPRYAVELVTALNHLTHSIGGVVNFSGFLCTDQPAERAKRQHDSNAGKDRP